MSTSISNVRILWIFLLATLLLSGCAGAAEPFAHSSSATLTAKPTDGSTSQPTPQPSTTPVEASAYASLLPTLTGVPTDQLAGVDFNSSDGNISCAIFDPSTPLWGGDGPWAGCYAQQKDFVLPIPVDGTDPGSALSVVGSAKASVFTLSDLLFVGASPQDAVRVKTLPSGSAITWSSVTCASFDSGIRCINSSTRHGFFLSRIAYSLF